MCKDKWIANYDERILWNKRKDAAVVPTKILLNVCITEQTQIVTKKMCSYSILSKTRKE